MLSIHSSNCNHCLIEMRFCEFMANLPCSLAGVLFVVMTLHYLATHLLNSPFYKDLTGQNILSYYASTKCTHVNIKLLSLVRP